MPACRPAPPSDATTRTCSLASPRTRRKTKRKPSAALAKPRPTLVAMKRPFEYEAVPPAASAPTSADAQPDGSVGVVLTTDMFDIMAVAGALADRPVTTRPT